MAEESELTGKISFVEYINQPHTKAYNARGEEATYSDVRYDSDELTNFDIWLAKSQQPTPLVIYIHGGGFLVGDKSKYHKSEDLVRFLDAGVSVATINYRFMNQQPYGILKCFNDVKRCLQFIRFYAKKYNIDKSKIACSGGSVGAGMALWLNFSDDMAQPQSNDPVLRESTRLACVGAFATQFTFDVFQWKAVLGVDMVATQAQKEQVSMAFGLTELQTDLEAQHEMRRILDFLQLMDKADPPIFVNNYHAATLQTADDINHHPLHAKMIQQKANEVGLKSVVYAPALGIKDSSGIDLVTFFLQQFGK